MHAATFEFQAQRHEDGHITVPMEIREALDLGIDGPVHLDIFTEQGHIHGDFEMTSNGEVRASRRSGGPNRQLLDVVPRGAVGFAVASRVAPQP